MCQKCSDNFARLFPDVESNDPICSELMWGATSYPAGSPEQIGKQLETLAAKRREKESMKSFVARMCAEACEEMEKHVRKWTR